MTETGFFRNVLHGIRGNSRRWITSPGILLVVVAPIIAVITFQCLKFSINAPAALLTTMALVFGGYLSAFVHYSTLRSRLAETEATYPNAQRPERDLVDTVAALLLFGAVSAVVAATYLALAMSMTTTPTDSALHSGYASAAIGLSSLPLLLFLYVSPLLHRGYQQVVAESRSAAFH